MNFKLHTDRILELSGKYTPVPGLSILPFCAKYDLMIQMCGNGLE